MLTLTFLHSREYKSQSKNLHKLIWLLHLRFVGEQDVEENKQVATITLVAIYNNNKNNMKTGRSYLNNSTLLFVVSTLIIIINTTQYYTYASSTPHAVSKWKSPNFNTSPQQAKQWQEEDDTLHSYISKSVPAVLEHTGSEAFDAHLKGVQAILRYWDAPKHLYDAGLFHSIYGTEGFQGFALPSSKRDAIRGLIGNKSEKLCWIFCMVDRSTVDETVFNWNINDVNNTQDEQFTFRARPELGRFNMLLNKREWLDFVELTLADWLEQVQGAAETPSTLFNWNKGEAYAYRRTAYAKMLDILSHERHDRLAHILKDMHADVYGTESSDTRHLVQLRTPPPSDAAKLALEALRAAGEDIPEKLLWPQPLQNGTCSSGNTCSDVTVAKDSIDNVYETDDSLNMYLELHYPSGLSEEIIDYTDSFIPLLRFPQRVAELLHSLQPVKTNNRALDVGCAVGGSSFQLATYFDHVEAFDYSENFIATAKRIQSGEQVSFQVPIEGDISEKATVETEVDSSVMKKVNFFRGNACELNEYADSLGTFDGVIISNLLCRLPDPQALPKIVNKGGVVVIVTPFSWFEEYTPKSKWLGGYVETDGQPIYSKDSLIEIMTSLGFEKIHDKSMPLAIREHQRKYQLIISDATGWRKL